MTGSYGQARIHDFEPFIVRRRKRPEAAAVMRPTAVAPAAAASMEHAFTLAGWTLATPQVSQGSFHPRGRHQRWRGPFTRRQAELLLLLVNGLTNAEIASELGISADTVKDHMTDVIHRLGARDRTHAAALIVRMGLVRVGDNELFFELTDTAGGGNQMAGRVPRARATSN